MSRRIVRVVWAVCVLSLWAQTVSAQTGACPVSLALVPNPTWVCLTASPDHNALDLGQPRLTSYSLQFFAPGVDPATGTPTQTISLGKGTPNPQSAIWIQRAELVAIPVGVQYVANAVSVGPAGTSGRSPLSNPFGRSNNLPPAAPGVVALR